jgi:hypothetical protein
MGSDGAPGSGRALRLDPFVLPVRYAARDAGADGHVRQIELDRERVVLRRMVRGIRMNVGMPVSAFCGVAMRTLPPEGGEPAAVAVTLEHRDSALSVPLFIAPEGDEALAQWKCWACVLGLPLLVVNGDGSLIEPLRRIGRLGVGSPAPRRRRRGALRFRRPSILLRRKPGRPLREPQVHRGEREIIARD